MKENVAEESEVSKDKIEDSEMAEVKPEIKQEAALDSNTEDDLVKSDDDKTDDEKRFEFVLY